MTGTSDRDNSIILLPDELKQRLREEFEKRYQYKKRYRWGQFECDWFKTLGDRDPNECPSKPTVRSVLKSPDKQACEYRIADGLCRLLLSCSYDKWMAQWESSRKSPQQPVQDAPEETPEPRENPDDRPIFSQFSLGENSDSADTASPVNEEEPTATETPETPSTPHNRLIPSFEMPSRATRRHWQPLARIAATALIAGIGGYFSLFPHLAGWANQLGKKYHRQREFPTAQFFYRSAALLNPRKGVYPYNLGWMCDEIADRDCAIAEYQRAALLGFPDAYAELGRLHLLEAEHPQALRSTRQCLQEAERNGERAACLKNLGWLRVAQQEWEEAESALREAIELNPDSAHSNCLLARVLEATDQKQAAMPFWIETLKYADLAVPEHDECIRQGNERLANPNISTSP
ncbi:MAG: tetratricopeptide repeat protein [Cyanobacteriota bacterium]|nr:tetratricopeptide repeat protein [Cyanobacteriota bacterium]